jgi:hypothetical protein
MQDKKDGIVKVAKVMKVSAFQFSLDSVNKSFKRELRDKENRDIWTDKLFL